jgi:hypothetical protein
VIVSTKCQRDIFALDSLWYFIGVFSDFDFNDIGTASAKSQGNQTSDGINLKAIKPFKRITT